VKEADAHDAHRYHHFLADWGGRRVACWCDYEGGGFGLVGDIVVGIITDRRLVVRPIGHRRWRTDRINHCRSRRRNHPHRHCPTYKTRVAVELGWLQSMEIPIGRFYALRIHKVYFYIYHRSADRPGRTKRYGNVTCWQSDLKNGGLRAI